MGKSYAPILVRLTPPGRGAVGTVLVEGTGAREVVEGVFRAKDGRGLGVRSKDRLVYGHVVGRAGEAMAEAEGEEAGEQPEGYEEVIVRCRVEDSVELHCHGGHAAAGMIEGLLVERGCRVVEWREWVGTHHEDPITAAAHRALADARTRRTAAILLDQYHGALRRDFDAIEGQLGRGETAALEQIDAVLGRASLGRHLVRPWRVAVAGPVNVGKSTLVNAVLGYTRAITHHTPGTTRDVLSATTAIDGWPVELLDTAGLRAGGDPMERAGVEEARRRLGEADLVVLVFDRSRPFTGEEQRFVDEWPSALVVHNKSDLAPDPGERPPGLATCALKGEGVEALLQAVASRLVPDPPPPGAAVPFAEEHIERLLEVRDSGTA